MEDPDSEEEGEQFQDTADVRQDNNDERKTPSKTGELVTTNGKNVPGLEADMLSFDGSSKSLPKTVSKSSQRKNNEGIVQKCSFIIYILSSLCIRE